MSLSREIRLLVQSRLTAVGVWWRRTTLSGSTGSSARSLGRNFGSCAPPR